MKKFKKVLISIILIGIIAGACGGLYIYLKNPNRLTSEEKHYLADTENTVNNINILNNINIFGKDGSGVFYDFIEDFKDKYNLQINNVAFNLNENVTNNVTLNASFNLNNDETVFYKDHYVLVSKDKIFIESPSLMNNFNVGVLNTDVSYLNSNIKNLNLVSYDSREALLEAFNANTDINYILVPLNAYLDTILKDNLNVAYHFSDVYYYYKINAGNNKLLASIMAKFYNSWQEDNFKEYYNNYLLNLFVSNLNISQTDVDSIKSKDYHYGFVNNAPYEILTSGNYGGIVAQYLKEFSDFSGAEFKFEKYNNLNKLIGAINSKSVDLYYGYYNIIGGYSDINSNLAVDYKILVNEKDDLLISSLTTLKNEEVYVLDNSVLKDYLENNSNLKIVTYKNDKELRKAIKKKSIIIVDSSAYEANKNGIFQNYNVRYSGTTGRDYKFKINSDDTFTTLFTKFVNIKDNHEVYYKGLYNYDVTLQSGTITGTIARYFMYVLIAVFIIFIYFYHVSKKVKVSKRIKKEDKLKYIDQLTSLKNRNYLSENLESWSKNTIYPQTIIVIDLNNLQYINDTMGYEKGDSQIKAAANILVKNQLDNSDIIRTDGNEFVIYMIGYQTKQVTSYIHKLTKEFKSLPYEYGAAISYSMITDDLKSVEDAINEAVEEVKKQKQSKKEE